MPLLVAGVVIALIVALFYLNRTSAETYIQIDPVGARVRRGRVDPQALAATVDILRAARVTTGYISISSDNRVAFSWHVPPALHQRLRNVLLRDRAIAMPRRSNQQA